MTVGRPGRKELRCTRCKRLHPPCGFTKNKICAMGLNTRCRDCASELAREKRKRTATPERQLLELWKTMIRRCHRPGSPSFERYGGRGIVVCSSWRESFESFSRDMGPRLPGTSLDRIDNDGNYEPGNCRWATKEEQENNKSSNVFIEHAGERLTVSQWARRLGISFNAMRKRLRTRPVELALTDPVASRFRSRESSECRQPGSTHERASACLSKP